MSGRRRRGRRPPRGPTGGGHAARSAEGRDAAPAPAVSSPTPGRHARRTASLLVLAGLLGVAGFVIVTRWTGELPSIPPSPPAAARAGPVYEDFLGAEACAECHLATYEAWRASTHGRAGGPPSPGLLLRPFDGRPFRFRDATVTPVSRADGRHAFFVAWDGHDSVTYEIEGVVGGAHLVGGGTQGFLTRWQDGTLRLLPFEVARIENTWFCNTDTRLDRGWLPITPELRLADCGDWPPVRVFGDIPRFGNCQECHGSQIEVSPGPGQPARTRYVSLTINCESCHGPGRRHAEIVRAGIDTVTDIGLPALEILDKDASLEVCFRCHALKDGLRPGYLPGRPFDEHYSVLLPLLSDAPRFADGRIRTFAYQLGHLWSDCYVSGSMTCVDCHDPHSQEYRDANGRPLPDRFDDGQCTGCHPSKADRLTEHTRHPADSPGSRCVACHMPYLQEPQVGAAIRYARSDHVIPIPRPQADAALGVEVACQLCHTDRSVATLEAEVRSLWGRTKPRPPLIDALLRAGPAGDGAAAAARLATPTNVTVVEYLALGTTLRDHLRPDMPTLDRTITERFERAAASPDPDIAAIGLAALHLARGDDRATRRWLVERTRGLGERDPAVRSRWALLLGFLADDYRLSGDVPAAITTYRKALEVRPADAAVLLNLGLAYAQANDPLHAETAYLASIAADSTRSLAWVNLGIARAARGDGVGAIMAYERALRVDPTDPLGWFNLGNVHLRADRPAQAVEPYQRAVRHAPGMAPAYFNLARALVALGRLDEARGALSAGLEFEPADTAAREALTQIDATLRMQSGRR